MTAQRSDPSHPRWHWQTQLYSLDTEHVTLCPIYTPSRYARFCLIQVYTNEKQKYFAVTASRPPSNAMFLGSPRVSTPGRILICSAMYAQRKRVTDTPRYGIIARNRPRCARWWYNTVCMGQCSFRLWRTKSSRMNDSMRHLISE